MAGTPRKMPDQRIPKQPYLDGCLTPFKMWFKEKMERYDEKTLYDEEWYDEAASREQDR